MAERAQIVLRCAEPGAVYERVAADLGVTTMTVGSWRKRFIGARLDGLADGVRPGRPKAGLVLADDERDQLTRWSRRAKTSQALALRSKIVLACAQGTPNKQVAADLLVTLPPWPSGAGGSPRSGWKGWRTSRGRAGRRWSCWTRSRRS
jgi:transposase-like protein